MPAILSLSSANDTSSESSRPAILPRLLSNELFLTLLNATLILDTIVAIFATGANIVTIFVYRKLGFSESSNISLTALAISDLIVALTTITCVLGIVLPQVIPNAPFTFDLFVFIGSNPHVKANRVSCFITAYISLERYLCILIPLKIKSLITPKRTFRAMVIIFVSGHFWMLFDPIIYSVRWEYVPVLNRTIVNTVPSTSLLAVILKGINHYYMSFLLPILTYSIVLVCTVLLSASLHRSKEWRDANRSTVLKSKDQPGTESAAVQSKEEKAVKMVIAIATVFIIATIPASIHVIAVVIDPEFDFGGRYVNLFTVTGMAFLMVDCLNCSANVFIYYNMSSKFKQATLELFQGKVRGLQKSVKM